MTVSADGVTHTVVRDVSHANGWDYLAGMDQIQLYGASCDLLKVSGDVELQLVVACKTVVEP